MKGRGKIKTAALLPSSIYTGCQSSNAWQKHDPLFSGEKGFHAPGTSKAATSTLELAFQAQWLLMNKLILLIPLFLTVYNMHNVQRTCGCNK